MPRFYIKEISLQNNFRLPENIVRHINVLRLKENTPIILFNGDGCEYHSVWRRENKREITAQVLSVEEINRESPLSVTLIQAVSTGERMDFTVQKSVELGATKIVPVISERSQHLSGERAEKRVARWREIIISACEQSGRNRLPEITSVLSLSDALAQEKADISFLLSPRGEKNMSNYKNTPQSLILLAGAEGGLSEEEEMLAVNAGFISCKLGKRILRTETAAVAALSCVQTLWGDF